MAKRALCVGINNYPGTRDDLDGCVNDAHAWASLLADHYDFAKSDIALLLDRKATHRTMLSGLKQLLAGARAGDVLVFTNSSHGTYIADHDSDEAGYDEALCPWDAKDRLLVDDELRELFSNATNGVRLTVVLDSCFSGTGTRAWPAPGRPRSRPRFLPPDHIGRPVVDTLGAKRRSVRTTEAHMAEVLLAGCSDEQESNDVDFPEGAHGALTYYALKTIADANYRITYSGLVTKVRSALRSNGFDSQTPQLEGKTSNKRRQIFT
jgi:metacaspase-1